MALDRMRADALAKSITNVEFDHPFMIVAGEVVDAPAGIHAPEVYHDDDLDVVIMGPWEAVSHGMTGQHGYRGPVMHSSEFVGPGIAEVLAEYEPGTILVMCVVETLDDDEEPAGWIILRLSR